MGATSSLLEIGRAVIRGWIIILVSIVVCVGGAYGVKLAIPKNYEATAVLTVEPLTISPGSGGTVDMETERVVASSTSVLSGAAEALGESLGEVQDAVVVTIPKGSRILEFTFAGSAPQTASDGANAVAQSYSAQRIASAQKAVDDTVKNQSEKIAELERQLAGEQEGSVSARAVELQISSLQERQAALTAATFYPGTLVSPATPPSRESGFGTLVFLTAGFALGALIGFFLALIRHRVRWERESESAASRHLSREEFDLFAGDVPSESSSKHAKERNKQDRGLHSRRRSSGEDDQLLEPGAPVPLGAERGPEEQHDESSQTPASLRLGPRRSAPHETAGSDTRYATR